MPTPMLFDPHHAPLDVESALWFGALLLASGHKVDVVPDELDLVMATYFGLFRPVAQA
jgi:hypothetical protein